MMVAGFRSMKRNITVLPSTLQQTWGWPVVANFVLGGAGAGIYLVSFVKEVMQGEYFALSKHFSTNLLGPVLAVLGFIALAIEAGHPLKGIHLFRGVQCSWLSRETTFWIIFVFFAVLDWFAPGPFFRIVSVLAALALMVSQGFILYQLRAIPAWNVPVILLFFISSGFVSGCGLLLLTGGLIRPLFSINFMLLVAIPLIANLVVWSVYLHRCRITAIEKDDKEPYRRFVFSTISLLGHIIPLVLLFVLAIWGHKGSDWLFYAESLTGLLILLGVIYQKKAIVLDAPRLKKVTAAL